jgi:polar amino acid transport system substrate-binding protein
MRATPATAVPSSAAASGTCAILAYVPLVTARNLRRMLAAALPGALLIAGCAAPTAAPGAAAVPLMLPVAVDRELAAAVPAEIAADGILDIGTDPSYRPMEYTDSDGRLTGVDIQLAQALAAMLDLRPVFALEAFTALESGIRAGRFEFGVAATSVHPGDALATDGILYLESGTVLARSVGSDATLWDLCGRSIAALEGSTQLTALSAQSASCRTAGREGITVVAGETQDAVTRSVLVGEAEAFVGDSPVVQAGVRSFAPELELVDGIVDPAPLAMLSPPSTGFADVVSRALDALIADGTYAAILASGGIVEGGVAQTVVLPVATPLPSGPVAEGRRGRNRPSPRQSRSRMGTVIRSTVLMQRR